MIRQEEVYKIGQLTKPHGVKGEVSFLFTDDIFDRTDCDYLVCLMDGILVPFYIEEYRFKSDTVALLKFEGIDTAEQARRFTNVEAFFPMKYVDVADDEHLTRDYFVGFKVTDKHAGYLGEITRVDDSTINTLFAINYQESELLVPAQEAFILKVDTQKRTITLQLPDGLLDINRAEGV